jgi:glycogen(starch) synthase
VRIAVFASSVHPHLGGVEELTLRLAQQYQARGHEVVVLTNRWPRDLAPFEVHEGVEIHRFPFRRSIGSVKSTLMAAATGGIVRRRVAALLRARRIEVVHVQCVSSNALYAMHAARDLGIPLVVTAQGELTMDAGRMYQRDPRARQLLEEVTAAASVVTGCSGRTLADVEAYLGHGFGARGRVVFNGTEVERFRRAEPHALGGRYVFALGRLVEQKGLDVLIRAFAASAPDDVVLVIAGDGPARDALTALARELAVADRVRLVGRADRSQVASYMAGAAAIAVPSVADEGFPLVGVEAMASGRPLVITETGGVREVMVSEETALIVPKGDADAFGAALARVLGDADLAARLGAAAQATAAARLDWSVLAGQYLAVFDEVTRP